MIQTQTFTLPIYWASYLINDDASGLTDDEQTEINEWCAAHAPGPCIDVGEAEFTIHGDDGPSGADRAEFTFQVADWY